MIGAAGALIGAVLVSEALIGPARAADLAARPAYVSAPVAPPVYNWTGLYVGVNGGYGWGTQDPLNIITNRFDQDTTSFSGGVFGGTVGGQIQSGHVVLGLEADLDWANMTGSQTFIPSIAGKPLYNLPVTANTKITWETTARTRLGYAMDNVLIYATLGLGILGAQTNLSLPSGATCNTFQLAVCLNTTKQLGAVLGGGVEYGFTPNMSAKLEYLYMTAASMEISKHSEIRGGLNWRFGGM